MRPVVPSATLFACIVLQVNGGGLRGNLASNFWSYLAAQGDAEGGRAGCLLPFRLLAERPQSAWPAMKFGASKHRRPLLLARARERSWAARSLTQTSGSALRGFAAASGLPGALH